MKKGSQSPDVDSAEKLLKKHGLEELPDLLRLSIEGDKDIARKLQSAQYQSRVTCSNCRREVTYKEGTCMYCGAQLSLKD